MCWISRPSATFWRTTNRCWRTARSLPLLSELKEWPHP
nr:MAG TPA: hypothetical protein [Caudoviricetes sp.]